MWHERTLLMVVMIVVVATLPASARTATPTTKKASRTKWISFPDPRLEVCGLPWFDENDPKLRRLPARAKDEVPEKVWKLAHGPSGARIRFASNTSELRIRVSSSSEIIPPRLDVYVNGIYWNTAQVRPENKERVFFGGADRTKKDITIYLPLDVSVRVLAIGVDADAKMEPAEPFALKRPVVFYGSSIMQGSHRVRSAMSYAAIVARQLNLDFVNLGFSGSGRAEPEVVRYINEIDACCFVFGLGKSYHYQPVEVYAAMLETIRASHPDVPIICITPIFSTREFFDAKYIERSVHTRNMARQAAMDRIKTGDKLTYLIEGPDVLLGKQDSEAFLEGVHPCSMGYQRIADRLRPILQKILFPKECAIE